VYLFGAGASMPQLPSQQQLLNSLFDATDYRVRHAQRYVRRVFPGANLSASATLEHIVGPLEIAEAEEYWFHFAGKAPSGRLITNRQTLESIDTWITQALDPASLPKFPRPGDAEYASAIEEYEAFYKPGVSYLGYARLFAFLTAQGRMQSTAFATLNYDLLLDRVLLAAGIPLQYAIEGFADPAAVPAGGPELFKLHGSLNWRVCGECHVLRNLASRSIWPGSRCYDCGARRAGPMLIRPTLLKDFKHRVWQDLWRVAGQQFAAAAHWVIVGYSLPLADVWVLRMLAQSALTRGVDPPKVTVINPDQGALDRFSLLFPQAECHLMDFATWLTTIGA
jgi:hypothetical protein